MFAGVVENRSLFCFLLGVISDVVNKKFDVNVIIDYMHEKYGVKPLCKGIN